MPRSNRVIIDQADFDAFENVGVAWYGRAGYVAFANDPVPPQEDFFTVAVPAVHTGTDAATQITVWGMGLISIGVATAEQIAHMAMLTAATDLDAFLAAFPGDYIAAGFRVGSYGDIEFGSGSRDPVSDPFNGGFYEPEYHEDYVGPTLFDKTQATDFAYVVWGGEPYEGEPEDWALDSTGSMWPDAANNIEFTEEGIVAGSAGAAFRFGDVAVDLGGGQTLYYSDLNIWDGGTAGDDINTVSTTPQRLDGLDGDDSLTGGAGADHLLGGADHDTLAGGGGTDRIEGGDGNDVLSDGNERGFIDGGAGDDLILADIGEDVIDGGTGTDRIVFDYSGSAEAFNFTFAAGASNYSLPGGFKSIANVEALTFHGGGGNDQLAGGAGDDVLSQGGGAGGLSGNGGNDRLTGGEGADYADGGEGADSLAGGGEADILIGGAGTDTISGGADHDRLDGNADADTIMGGDGGDRLAGGDGNDKLSGEGGRDRLTGGGGNDTLDGGTASGPLVLMAGDPVPSLDDEPQIEMLLGVDGYYQSNFAFTVTDSNVPLVLTSRELAYSDEYGEYPSFDYYYEVYDAGNNVVGSGSIVGYSDFWASDIGAYTLAIYVSVFDTTRGPPRFTVSRETFDEAITRDTMEGGLGNDVYVVDSRFDQVVEQADQGTDDIRTNLASFSLANVANIERLIGGGANQALFGDDAGNTIDGGAGADTLTGGLGDDIYFIDDAGDRAVEAAGGGTDRVLSSVTHMLGAEVEILALTGTAAINGIGNDLNNVLSGNAGANRLDGGAGADTMGGGLGDDAYVIDNARDRVVEAAGGGSDRVITTLSQVLGAEVEILVLAGTAAINGTGNALANTITGNAADNRIDGGLGADTMAGAAGADSYFVDNARDRVIEAAGGGNDRVTSSVSFALGAEVEILALTGTAAINGTGNGLNNIISGNAAANRLDGGAGADTLGGGLGDDSYFIDAAGDLIVEAAGGGNDRVTSSVSYAIGAEIEILALAGASAIDAIGNALDNVIAGNGAVNRLNGGIGADTLGGGLGDDIYVIDNAGDRIVEAAGGGADRVVSSISYALASQVEHLVLTGAAEINGTGNTLANRIDGNAAANQLSGGAGLDTLVGGGGMDMFRFDSAAAAGNADRLLDFSSADDTLRLAKPAFAAIATGTLGAAAFQAGAVALDASDRILYDKPTGRIFYDADGNGAGAAVLLATLNAGAELSRLDFVVI